MVSLHPPTGCTAPSARFGLRTTECKPNDTCASRDPWTGQGGRKHHARNACEHVRNACGHSTAATVAEADTRLDGPLERNGEQIENALGASVAHLSREALAEARAPLVRKGQPCAGGQKESRGKVRGGQKGVTRTTHPHTQAPAHPEPHTRTPAHPELHTRSPGATQPGAGR
eukprot:1190390-Prorocentrum_minimum.AAC.1